MSETDSQLVQRGRAGDSDAIAELVRRWSARVLAVCHARVRRRDIAEELSQEALLRGFRKLASIQSNDRFGPWICSIARHVCLDWLKSKQSSQKPFSEFEEEGAPLLMGGDSTSEQVEQDDEFAWLMRQVHQLNDKQREVMMLFYYDGMSYQELADLLGVSSATINARLTKARAKLRERARELRKS